MTREEKIRAAAEEAHTKIDQIQLQRRENKGSCTQCRFHHYNAVAGWTQHCTNPLIAPPKYNPINDEVWQPEIGVDLARSSHGLCGPSGVLFVPKPTPDPQVMTREGFFTRFLKRKGC